MPWLVRQRGEEYCVFKEGADGQPTGASLGCHASREAAQRQQRALYANEEKSLPGFMCWKDASTGLYRWLSIYSNKYRDDDYPAEIISEKSQVTFVEMVNKGIVDYPELWLWHVPVAWGKADYVDYITGYALAGGYVYPGYEFVAENLSKETNLATSHGMPLSLILRDPDDPTVIVFHITKEISPLPAHRAANKRTGFVLLKGDVAMPFPDDKKAWLADTVKLPATFIKQLEDHLDAMVEEAEKSGVEYKEQSDPAQPVAVAAAVEAETPAPEPVAEPETPAAAPSDPVVKEVQYATREEVASVVTEVMQPILETAIALTARVEQLSKELRAVQKVEADNQEKLKEVTPPLSLKELVARNLIGNPAARLDANSPLHQDKPKEKEASSEYGPTIVPFLNGILSDASRTAL